MPLGSMEFLSPGIVLRLTTTPTISKMREAWSPLSFVPSSPTILVQSTFTRCVSVPPNGTRSPRFSNWSAIAFAFFKVCACNFLNCAVWVSLKVNASAANTFTCGPPCSPGKTALSIFFAIAASVVINTAPRGPSMLLCVVDITTWAYPIGDGTTPAATSPPMCEMSVNK